MKSAGENLISVAKQPPKQKITFMTWTTICTNVLCAAFVFLVSSNITKRVVYLKNKNVKSTSGIRQRDCRHRQAVQWRQDENETNITERRARAGSSCFDTHPAFPVTTSPHLPLCAGGAALWEQLSHPSLSSFKLSVSCRREDLSEFGGKSLTVVSTHLISPDHSIIPGIPPLDQRRILQLFLNTK